MNNTAELPKGLTLETESALGYSEERAWCWNTRLLTKDSEFDLGQSGRLRVLTQCEQGVLVKWEEPRMLSQVKDSIKERVLKTSRSPYHWELMYSHSTSEAIAVHITSNPRVIVRG